MKDQRKIVAKVLAGQTNSEISELAKRYGLLNSGRVDLRCQAARFSHVGLDLSMFLLDGASLSRSHLIDFSANNTSFRGVTAIDARFEASPGSRSSFRNACFDNAVLRNCFFGPATLNLEGSSFVSANLKNVTFMLGRLSGANFKGSTLKSVVLRSADLTNVSFGESTLERVCLENAVLRRTDFTCANFIEMDFWGEPDYSDAIISDDLRFSFGIVRDPINRLDFLLSSDRYFSAAEKSQVLAFLHYLETFAKGTPEVMLLYREASHVLEVSTFITLLKLLKNESLYAS